MSVYGVCTILFFIRRRENISKSIYESAVPADIFLILMRAKFLEIVMF